MSQILRVKIKGGKTVEYRGTVFLINTRHPDGTPALCTLIQDQHKIELAGGEEFMTAFVPNHMIRGDGSKAS